MNFHFLKKTFTFWQNEWSSTLLLDLCFFFMSLSVEMRWDCPTKCVLQLVVLFWDTCGFSISTQLNTSCSVVCSPQSVIVTPQLKKALRCVYSHHLLGQLISALPQSLTSVNSSIRKNCCAFIGFFSIHICLRSHGVQDTFNIGASVWVCPTAFL